MLIGKGGIEMSFSVGEDSGNRPWRITIDAIEVSINWMGYNIALTDPGKMTIEECEQLCKILNDHKFIPKI